MFTGSRNIGLPIDGRRQLPLTESAAPWPSSSQPSKTSKRDALSLLTSRYLETQLPSSLDFPRVIVFMAVAATAGSGRLTFNFRCLRLLQIFGSFAGRARLRVLRERSFCLIFGFAVASLPLLRRRPRKSRPLSSSADDQTQAAALHSFPRHRLPFETIQAVCCCTYDISL